MVKYSGSESGRFKARSKGRSQFLPSLSHILTTRRPHDELAWALPATGGTGSVPSGLPMVVQSRADLWPAPPCSTAIHSASTFTCHMIRHESPLTLPCNLILNFVISTTRLDFPPRMLRPATAAACTATGAVAGGYAVHRSSGAASVRVTMAPDSPLHAVVARSPSLRDALASRTSSQHRLCVCVSSRPCVHLVQSILARPCRRRRRDA